MGPEEPGKDEWQRRAKKRQEGAAAVKKRTKKDNLNAATELFECGGGYPARPRPRTPDPTDSTVSNREWEKGVQPWRKDLKWLAAGASQTRHPGPQKGAARAQVDVHSPRAADLGGESERVAGSEDEPVRAELSDAAADEVRADPGRAAAGSRRAEGAGAQVVCGAVVGRPTAAERGSSPSLEGSGRSSSSSHEASGGTREIGDSAKNATRMQGPSATGRSFNQQESQWGIRYARSQAGAGCGATVPLAGCLEVVLPCLWRVVWRCYHAQ